MAQSFYTLLCRMIYTLNTCSQPLLVLKYIYIYIYCTTIYKENMISINIQYWIWERGVCKKLFASSQHFFYPRSISLMPNVTDTT